MPVCLSLQVVGGDRCPIVDTYWQTETGAHVLAPLPGVWPAKPGSATLPFFGVQPAMVNEQVSIGKLLLVFNLCYPALVWCPASHGQCTSEHREAFFCVDPLEIMLS